MNTRQRNACSHVCFLGHTKVDAAAVSTIHKSLVFSAAMALVSACSAELATMEYAKVKEPSGSEAAPS